MTEVAVAVDVVTKGIDAAGKALKLYDEMLDRLIPWKTFEDASKTLKQYQHDYSTAAGEIVGKITTLLLDAKDQYGSAVRLVYEWCSLVCPLLNTYLELFDNYNKEKAEVQKKFLMKVLQNGIDNMNSAQVQLEKSSMSLNASIGNLSSLNTMLGQDFDEKSAYFNDQVSKIRKEAYGGAGVGVIGGPFGLLISYSIAAGVVEGKLIPELVAKLAAVANNFQMLSAIVKDASNNLESAKLKLSEEIKIIGDMKTKADETKMYVDADDLLVQKLKDSAKSLITLASAYQQRHSTAQW